MWRQYISLITKKRDNVRVDIKHYSKCGIFVHTWAQGGGGGGGWLPNNFSLFFVNLEKKLQNFRSWFWVPLRFAQISGKIWDFFDPHRHSGKFLSFQRNAYWRCLKLVKLDGLNHKLMRCRIHFSTWKTKLFIV